MRSAKAAIVVVLLLGLALAAGNLWVTAARTTIPLSLNDTVAAKEVRREKLGGVDDVHLLTLVSGRVLHVDGAVYDAVRVGDAVHKSAWSRTLDAAGRAVPLAWSDDAKRMAVAMPAAAVLMAGLATFAWPRR